MSIHCFFFSIDGFKKRKEKKNMSHFKALANFSRRGNLLQSEFHSGENSSFSLMSEFPLCLSGQMLFFWDGEKGGS